jgi:hypothetical protein
VLLVESRLQSAQAEGRAEKAEQAQAAAEAARDSAEQLRQQIQAEAEVLMPPSADTMPPLRLWQHPLGHLSGRCCCSNQCTTSGYPRAQAAAAVADLERQQRAAATGEAEALRADAERRAKAFNAAVAAAVGRIRSQLEAECSSLVARSALSAFGKLSKAAKV